MEKGTLVLHGVNQNALSLQNTYLSLNRHMRCMHKITPPHQGKGVCAGYYMRMSDREFSI